MHATVDELQVLWSAWQHARRELDAWLRAQGDDFEGIRRVHRLLRAADAYRTARRAAREERRSRIGREQR